MLCIYSKACLFIFLHHEHHTESTKSHSAIVIKLLKLP